MAWASAYRAAGSLARARADDPVQLGRYTEDEERWGARILAHDPRDDASDRLALEGRPAGEKGEPIAPGGKDVRARSHGAARGLLGGHVERRAQELAGARQVVEARLDLGDPEVHDLRLTRAEDHDVGRLHVPGDDPVEVGVVQGASHAGQAASRLPPLEAAASVGQLGEGASPEVLESDEEGARLAVAPHVVDDHDPGMLEARGHPRLREEPRLEGLAVFRAKGPGMDRLQGDGAAKGGIVRHVDDPHGAAAQLASDLVVADPRRPVLRVLAQIGRDSPSHGPGRRRRRLRFSHAAARIAAEPALDPRVLAVHHPLSRGLRPRVRGLRPGAAHRAAPGPPPRGSGGRAAAVVGPQTLHLTGTRFAVERAPGLRAHTSYIFVSNHQSMFDVALLGGTMLTSFPRYVAKKELARGLPSVSFHLREGGNAVIDRNNRQQALAAIRELGQRAEARGVSVVIYPEGTRAREGTLKPFKLAGSLALLEAAPNLAVVPVAVDGSWKIVRHRFLPVPFGTGVRFHLGEPIPRQVGEDREALLRRVEGEIGGDPRGVAGHALAG